MFAWQLDRLPPDLPEVNGICPLAVICPSYAKAMWQLATVFFAAATFTHLMATDCSFCAATLPYAATRSFSSLVYDYLNGDPKLDEFYTFPIDFTGVEKAIAARKEIPFDREPLVKVLKDQYRHLPYAEKCQSQIESLLSPQTFTVTTAHQPNLFTGYLYFIYKIVHAIRLAEELNKNFPQQHFVPVYYMGSEDNDIEELGTFFYEGKKYRWHGDGSNGAVGRMSTDSLKPLLHELLQKMGPPGPNLESLTLLLQEAYLEHETISKATQFLVHQLFEKYGLLVLDPDVRELKQLFVPFMEEELLQENSLPAVAEAAEKMAPFYKAQAYARPINLFYLKDGIRERIEKNNGKWEVLHTDISWNQQEMLNVLKEQPESFSPNVILRPLFQETILPDVAFIGGGSELAYWLQLKALFKQKNVFFPVVLLRQSVLILDEKAVKLQGQLGFQTEDLFLDPTAQENLYLERQGKVCDISEESEAIKKAMLSLQAKAFQTAPELAYSAGAALAKMQHQLKVVEKKMLRAEKKKEAVAMQWLAQLREQVFPQGTLQERKENFLPYYLKHGASFISLLHEHFDPLDASFLILSPYTSPS